MSSIRVSYSTWQEAIRNIATFWNANFNGSDRLTRGIDSKDDLIVDDTMQGLVLKSPNAHYWRASISNAGEITWTDLGATKP